MISSKPLKQAVLGLVICIWSGLAPAQQAQWPNRPVKIVVPYAPGGGTDILGRVLGERLQTVFGQPFVVDNRPGAGANIGTAFVAKQPADGYTLLMTTNTHAMNVAFYKKLPYDPVKDFSPVSLIATSPLLMTVNASSPAKTAAEFVAMAKSKSGVLTYGSTGIGAPQHLAPAMLESAAGVEMIHVPYKGAGLVANALLGNEVDMAIGAVNSLLPHIKAGKLRGLAIADPVRSKLLPGVPTMAEALKLPGYSVELWYAVLVPAGTPKPIVDLLNKEINKVMRDPILQNERFAPLGLEGVGSTPSRLADVINSDIPKYLKAARDANISPE